MEAGGVDEGSGGVVGGVASFGNVLVVVVVVVVSGFGEVLQFIRGDFGRSLGGLVFLALDARIGVGIGVGVGVGVGVLLRLLLFLFQSPSAMNNLMGIVHTGSCK